MRCIVNRRIFVTAVLDVIVKENVSFGKCYFLFGIINAENQFWLMLADFKSLYGCLHNVCIININNRLVVSHNFCGFAR